MSAIEHNPSSVDAKNGVGSIVNGSHQSFGRILVGGFDAVVLYFEGMAFISDAIAYEECVLVFAVVDVGQQGCAKLLGQEVNERLSIAVEQPDAVSTGHGQQVVTIDRHGIIPFAMLFDRT